MQTPQELFAAGRLLNSRFLGFISQMAAADPFEGLVTEIPAPTGTIDYGDVYPVGEMEDVIGTELAKVSGLRAVQKRLSTKDRRITFGLSITTRQTTNAIAAGSADRALASGAGAVVADRRKRLTNLLINGGTDTGMFANTANGKGLDAPFFKATNKFIPRTDIGFLNAFTEDSTSSAAVFRRAILRRLAHFMTLPNTMGGFVHNPPAQGAAFVVMVPPVLFDLAVDAFGEAGGSAVVGLNRIETVVAGLSISFRVNPFLAAESSDVAGAKWYLFARDQVYTPFVAAIRQPQEMRSTLGDRGQAHMILWNAELFQPFYGMEVGYGSDFQAIKMTDN
jgi:hypothetical protein